MDWHSEDENEVEGQDHLDLNSTIAPTGSDLDDVIETAEFLDHDDTEHRLESNVGTTDDFDWKEEGFNDTNFSILYRRLTCLMFHGHFHEAKVEASYLDRWLLVNVQDSEQLNSHLLNRETWLNVTIQELLRSYFIFWQDLMRFSDRSPRQLLFAGTRREDASAPTDQTVEHEEATLSKETSHVSTTKPSYPPLPEEPTDKKLIYREGICFLSGQRVQRRTHAEHPWSKVSAATVKQEWRVNFSLTRIWRLPMRSIASSTLWTCLSFRSTAFSKMTWTH